MPNAEPLAGNATLENLRGDIAALANQVHGLRRDQTERPAAVPPVCNLDKLSGEIATMSTALRGMFGRYLEHSEANEPVHTWPVGLPEPVPLG